jgi:hypothetical protein
MNPCYLVVRERRNGKKKEKRGVILVEKNLETVVKKVLDFEKPYQLLSNVKRWQVEWAFFYR